MEYFTYGEDFNHQDKTQPSNQQQSDNLRFLIILTEYLSLVLHNQEKSKCFSKADEVSELSKIMQIKYKVLTKEAINCS